MLELLELLELDLDLECELFECELLSPIPSEAVTSLEGKLAGSGMHPACEGECNKGKGDRSVLEDTAKENTRARWGGEREGARSERMCCCSSEGRA